jgi:3-dehydroquinate synthase
MASARHLAPQNLILYGPPGSGKTAVGVRLAKQLGREFVDTDALIAERTGKAIAEIFQHHGEAAFRDWEAKLARELAARSGLIIAPGGGMLLDMENRRLLQASGRVIFLHCDLKDLQRRISRSPDSRPLLPVGGREGLRQLLTEREAAYRSFPERVDTTSRDPGQVVEEIARLIRSPRVHAFTLRQPTEITHGRLGGGLLRHTKTWLEEYDLRPPYAIISDSNVAPLYAQPLAASLDAETLMFPAGEAHKRLDTAARLYAALLEAGMDRGGTVLALGGGVCGDLAGYVAATFMRGLPWVNLPTTSLAMVDASLGGKVGVDLPQGKNLVGAFHPPALILADTDTLATLPEAEFRTGMAELVKAALIADPLLFSWLEAGQAKPTQRWIERAQRVKIRIVEQDPREHGPRAKLNLGHTVAHGLEVASDYRLGHGEAVAIGMVAEAYIAQALGLAEPGLTQRIEHTLTVFGLPIRTGDVKREWVQSGMRGDKKRRRGELRYSLPRGVGKVAIDQVVPTPILKQALSAILEE